ncbi:MAG: Sec-independent protein translocase protein TatB, partial [Pseudomonadota bacterium]|nr:Sec-independent protein translocase protein TatB [Pseudomonadota bacterium]
QELFLIGLITILVVGPREIPRVLRTVVAAVRKVRGLANDFQRGIDELARETELDEIRRDIEKGATLDLERELEETIDPKGEMSEAVEELQAEFKETGEEIEEQSKISTSASHPDLHKTQTGS